MHEGIKSNEIKKKFLDFPVVLLILAQNITDIYPLRETDNGVVN